MRLREHIAILSILWLGALTPLFAQRGDVGVKQSDVQSLHDGDAKQEIDSTQSGYKDNTPKAKPRHTTHPSKNLKTKAKPCRTPRTTRNLESETKSFRTPRLSKGLETVNAPSREFFGELYSSNPSSILWSVDLMQYGEIGVSYGYTNRERLHSVQQGRTDREFKLGAKGLTAIGRSLFWGEISYTNSLNRGINWSSVSDAERLGPYIVADSIGGTIHGESYYLMGGFSSLLGRWNLAGQASYRAGNSFRKRDPRPKATTTELDIKLSLAYSLPLGYSLGLTGQIERYEQSLEIMVKQNKNYDFFVLRGFGQFHRQLSEHRGNFSWQYKGQSYGGSIFIAPHRSGLVANASLNYSYLDTEKEATYTPFTLKTMWIDAQLGWQHQSDRRKWFAKVSYHNSLRKGTERVYYYQKVNEVFGEYFLLSSGQFYSKKSSRVALSGLHQWQSDRRIIWVGAEVGINKWRERYAFPQYELSFDHLVARVNLGGEFRVSKRSSLVPELKVSYSNLLKSNVLVDVQDRIVQESILPNVEYWRAGGIGIDLGMTYQYKLKGGHQLFTSLNGGAVKDGAKRLFFVGASVGFRY